MTATSTTEKKKGGGRVAVQKFGTFLSSMIMPNIGAFIAWGLVTALFIPKGFFPNEKIGSAVDPMVFYLLPILIAYTGGKLVYEHRGGVVGAVATIGVIMGTSAPEFVGTGDDAVKSPMFLGAMIMGPLAAWCMKKLDGLWDGKIKPGFEMLVNNFSAGIFGALAMIGSMFLLTPVMNFIMWFATVVVDFLIDHSLLPVTSLLIEPAKVLFLNNAVNHGVLTPLATEQVGQTGKSILFLLEANPGPGVGVLLAYCIFGKGSARATAPGAALIHFVGGIHEIYFPYVLMKPQLLIATICGGMSGILVESLFHVGLVGPAAPGSILAVFAMTAKDSYLGVALGVLAAAAVSFAISSVILKTSKSGDGDLAKATADMESMKGKKSSVSGALVGNKGEQGEIPEIKNIVFACDAGMGSSAMGASVLRNKIKDAGYGNQVTVVNKAINALTDQYDLLVSHEDLADRAAAPTPSAHHVAVDNFMQSPRYDEIVELIKEQHRSGSSTAANQAEAPAKGERVEPASPASPVAAETSEEKAATQENPENAILTASSIELDQRIADRDAAIDEAGRLLVASGTVDQSYVAAMHERETSVSTFMGNGLAIPHGTNEAKSAIHSSAISFVRLQDEIEWNPGKKVRFVIGIAGAGDDHLVLLQKIAKIFGSKAEVAKLEAAKTSEEVLDIFGKVNA